MSPNAPRQRGPRTQKVDAPRILEAAQAVFARDGFQGATLRAIAKSAGCDPALIYYHFENKEALLQALLDRKIPPLMEEIRALADPADTRNGALRFWQLLGIYHRHLAEDAGFRACLQGGALHADPALQGLIARNLRPLLGNLAGLFAQEAARGSLRKDLPPVLGVFFFVRGLLEVLDVIPAMAGPMMGLPGEQALVVVERLWFETWWRGCAQDPTAPLPGLPGAVPLDGKTMPPGFPPDFPPGFPPGFPPPFQS